MISFLCGPSTWSEEGQLGSFSEPSSKNVIFGIFAGVCVTFWRFLAPLSSLQESWIKSPCFGNLQFWNSLFYFGFPSDFRFFFISAKKSLIKKGDHGTNGLKSQLRQGPTKNIDFCLQKFGFSILYNFMRDHFRMSVLSEYEFRRLEVS